MPFVKYNQVESPVYACQLTLATQQEITDEISSSVTMGQLADWQVKLNDLNNCQEHTFRYKNSTTKISLGLNDWLVRMSDGTLRVYNFEEFALTFVNGEVDYNIPVDSQKDFTSALLEMVNSTFPELYMGNVAPKYEPYTAIIPAGADCSEQFSVALDGVSVVVSPADPKATGSQVVGGKVRVKLASPENITKYLISMEGDSYNAPTAWKVKAINTQDGIETDISTVVASDEKKGFYSPTVNVIADVFEFEFESFEMPNYRMKNFRLSVTKGGQYIQSADPEPFKEFTPVILAQVAEKLAVWYNMDSDIYTINLPTRGIVSMRGLSDILPTLLTASFIKPTTEIYFNLSNNVITESRQPNILNTPALQEFAYEIQKLPASIRNRITGMNFMAMAEDVPSAIAKSVTFNTDVLLDQFIETIIKVTGIQNPGEIKY